MTCVILSTETSCVLFLLTPFSLQYSPFKGTRSGVRDFDELSGWGTVSRYVTRPFCRHPYYMASDEQESSAGPAGKVEVSVYDNLHDDNHFDLVFYVQFQSLNSFSPLQLSLHLLLCSISLLDTYIAHCIPEVTTTHRGSSGSNAVTWTSRNPSQETSDAAVSLE